MEAICDLPRGCGKSRKQGGVYCEVGVMGGGRNIENFLIDPPIRVPSDLHLAALGVQLVQRGETWHILDKVGREFYPNVADFIEEASRLGLSRRLSSALDFSKLTTESRIILAHDRAYVENWEEWKRPNSEDGGWTCPKALPQHAPHRCEECCAGVWWQDVERGEPIGVSSVDLEVRRHMPAFSYEARQRPPRIYPKYSTAFFASFRLSRLAVVAGNDHEENLARAQKAHLRCDLVKE